MKQLLFYLKRLPKRFAMAMAVASAVIALPLSSMAAADARLEGSIGVANQTRNETQYKESTAASYNEVVKFSVYYHNRELPDSGLNAENLKVKVDLPTTAGTAQNVKVTIGGTNTNTITDTATVNLDRADAKLEFIPGSVYWKHNVGSRENINYVTEKIADSKILNGEVIETSMKPCFEYEATVTFQMRVVVPSVGITKTVRKAGTKDTMVEAMQAKAGDRVEYVITAKNLSNTPLTNVYLRDALPQNVSYVPGTVKKFYGEYKGTVMTADEEKAFFTGKKNIGSIGPGAQAFIVFEAIVADASKLACGTNALKNIAVVDTDQTGEYNNDAIVTVTKECAEVAAYSCDLLKVTKGDNRTVTVSEFKTSATNGATFKDVVINWGDNTDNLTTNNPVGQKHQYANDSEYTITATARFNVNGQVKEAKSDACVAKVNFAAPTIPTPTPTVLPNTGAGSVAGIFAAVTAAGAMAHRIVLARRLS